MFAQALIPVSLKLKYLCECKIPCFKYEFVFVLMFHEALSKTLPGKFSGTIKVSRLAWQLNLANHDNSTNYTKIVFLKLYSHAYCLLA